MISLSSFNVVESAGLLAVSLIGVVFTLQKILKNFKSESAESNIITLMHKELGRLSDQNTKLSEELSAFQLQVVDLNKQIQRLTLENQRLHNEVARLHDMLELTKSKENNTPSAIIFR
jgi:peptidoglycan hydrolase CwlO-like protein